jgi:hypothetical protein
MAAGYRKTDSVSLFHLNAWIDLSVVKALNISEMPLLACAQ